MSITIIPCNTRCLNMGDVAMLQVAVSRLRARWPAHEIRAFTTDPAALRRYCPAVTPVSLPDQPEWCRDRYVGGRLHDWLPSGAADALAQRYVAVAARSAGMRERLLAIRAIKPADRRSLRLFLSTIADSQLVLTSGAGGIADLFTDYSNLALFALQAAQRRRIATAIVSHGFGPLTVPAIRQKAAAVLPHVDLIAVREGLASPALLAGLGVSPDRVVVTGDDAIELVTNRPPLQAIGDSIGVNLRLARATAATPKDILTVRAGLERFAATRPAQFVPLPIARQQALDADVIRQLVSGLTSAVDTEDPDTPDKVIARTARCRIVVTGAYHAAVFALAQGIPAVCLLRSDYSAGRFGGLASLFGRGCYVLSLDAPDLPAQLASLMETAWTEAPLLREPLRMAALRQVEAGQRAYSALEAALGAARADGREPGIETPDTLPVAAVGTDALTRP